MPKTYAIDYRVLFVAGGSLCAVAWFLLVPNLDLPSNRGPVVSPASGAGHSFVAGPEESPEDLRQRCQERASRFRRSLGFSADVRVYPPFVMAAGSDVDLEAKYRNEIRPFCAALEKQLFDRPPDRPVAVLLFTEEAAYRTAAERLFYDRDVSRFGYYKPGRRVVMANLAYGDASLRHELVHALMQADFPEAPPWLQEGLATLHEEVRTGEAGHDGSIEPMTTWRLTILHRALRAGRVLPVRRLIQSRDLSGAEEAIVHAQACYLCMYLHDGGHLASIYRGVRALSDVDPSGQRAWHNEFPDLSWSEFDRSFHRWVLALTSPD